MEAQSFGEPGHRTFRLWVAVPGRSASLWLEKEQLVALGNAIGELFEAIPVAAADLPPADAAGTPDLDDEPTIDLHVGSLALGYDQQSNLLRIYIGATGGFPADPPAFSCFVTRTQLRDAGQRIEQIVNAGRPNCPLCHQPVDPGGHACPKQNGHSKQAVPPISD